MDQLLNGLMSMGTVGVFIGLALAGLSAWFYSGEKAKAEEKAEAERKKAREDLQEWEREQDEVHTRLTSLVYVLASIVQEWEREQDEVHTLPFEEGDDEG